MLVSMSDKELKRLSVLQEICDQRITQSQAAQLLHISERQIRRLLQKYKAQGPAALAHAARGQTSNSKLPEELRLKCLNMIAEQFHGFGPTLAHEKLTTVHGFDIMDENQHGGAREGSGRKPVHEGPTKVIRVPETLVLEIRQYLDQVKKPVRNDIASITPV